MQSKSGADFSVIDALISPPIPVPLPQPKRPLKLAILASGKGSNMAAIATAIQQGELNATINVVIYNNASAQVNEKAQQYGIPSILLDHRTFPSREALDQAIIQTVKSHQANWIIMAGWMRRVTEVLIRAFPNRILNIHPSILPSFPGVRAPEQAIAAGAKVSGCTVHLVELAVDSGPIIMQAVVPIFPDDTAKTLQERIQSQEHVIYPAAIAIAAGQLLEGT